MESGDPSRAVRSRRRTRPNSVSGAIARGVASSQPGATGSKPWAWERTTRT